MMAKTKLRYRSASKWLVLGLLAAGAAAGGCRVNDSDVKRWGSTEHGPDKLVAVVTHDKYDWPLRVEAGLELLRMRPRNGRRIGINRLVEATAQMGGEDRKRFLAELLPGLLGGIQSPPPQGPDPGGDLSIPFKDGAMALLSYDKVQLLTDEDTRKKLYDALTDWLQHDFERRLDNTSQMFGLEQMVRFMGAPSVRGLPALISADSTRFDRIASFVADFGDAPTKDAAGQKLVDLARFTNSSAWLERQKPVVQEANKASKLNPTPQQLEAQLKQYQDEALTKVFASLKKIGTRAAVDYCLSVAVDKAQDPKRRQAALAALEGRLDKSNPGDVEKVLALAAEDETPDEVRDLAFQRVGEMPREQVVEKLYGLFSAKKWKVRWVAADTVLKMSNVDQLAEFMSKLPGGAAQGFAIVEPLKYGDAIGRMASKDGKKTRDVVLPFVSDHAGLAPRLTALGFFYANGAAADLPIVNALAADKTPTPRVDDPDAKWQCQVAKGDGKDSEVRDIKTVGEFVTFCVVPAMNGR